jgi:ABC-type nitrate/sulfonate/bicarbonate transport system substrate-binding protein
MLRAVVKSLGPLVASCLISGACASRPPAPVSLRVGHGSGPSCALFFLAQDRGLLQAEGLSVQSIPYESGRIALDDAFSGVVDVALVYGTPVTLRVLAGDDVAVVGTLYRADRLEGVVTRAGSGIKTPADLAGHRVGFSPRTSSERLVDLLLAESGTDPRWVERVPGSQADLLAALRTGRVDAASLWLPARFAAQRRSTGPVFTTRSHLEISMVAGPRRTLAAKHEAVVRLLRGLLAAEALIRSDPSAIRRTLHQHFPELTSEDVETILSQARFEVRLSNLLVTSLRQEAVWLEEHGTFRAPGVRIGDVPQTEPLESVAPEMVTLLAPVSPTGAVQ